MRPAPGLIETIAGHQCHRSGIATVIVAKVEHGSIAVGTEALAANGYIDEFGQVVEARVGIEPA